TVDESGKVTFTPLTPAELENVNALVRETIGFNRERGDSINVVNAPFTEIEAPKETPLAIWQQPENIALARDLGKQLGLLLLAVVVIFTLIRPALKALGRQPAPAARVAERIDDPLQLPLPSGSAAAAPARQD